jgi:hypothetical protein
MYDFIIREMAEQVAEDLAANGEEPTAEFITDSLAEYWRDGFAHTWHIHDVICQAENRGIELSEQDAREIFSNLLGNVDCNIGVSWEVIDIYTDWHIENREQQQQQYDAMIKWTDNKRRARNDRIQ